MKRHLAPRPPPAPLSSITSITIIVAIVTTLSVVGVADAKFVHLPEADYCGAGGGSLADRCCNNRIDSCSVPVLGTLCYCDQFCNRTDSNDCCPDYWQVCLGVAPPEEFNIGCYHEGQIYPQGHTIDKNCNKCECRRTSSDSAEFVCDDSACIVQEDLIDEINRRSARLGWRAANYSQFWARKLADGLVLRLGTLEPERFVLGMYPIKQKYDRNTLPRNFDGRVQWRNYLQPIQDQEWCGSSWAFSTTAVASDRLAIQTNGQEVYSLSVQNLLACNNRGQQGCNGGHLDRAWNYMRRFGVVDEDCYPYTSGSSGSVEKCRAPRKASMLSMRCRPKDREASKRTELFRTPPAYRVAQLEEDIMNEIRERGPVQATMKVHPDFFVYRYGIYRNSGLKSGQRAAYHSVRIVGWGVDESQAQPTKYWLVANSWGRWWGEDGYFRILRGDNESDIERFVLAAWAEASRN